MVGKLVVVVGSYRGDRESRVKVVTGGGELRGPRVLEMLEMAWFG